MAYYLLILLTAQIFIRPSEWYAPAMGIPVYQILIIACLVFSWPVVLRQLSLDGLRNNPITACVIGVLVAIIVSQAINTIGAESQITAYEFAKIVIYYLLFVGLIDSQRKLIGFFRWIVVIVSLSTLVPLLDYYGVIEIASQEVSVSGMYDEASGQMTLYDRISGPGNMLDSNDFAVVLVVSLVLCGHLILTASRVWMRLLWLLPFGLVLHSLWLTQSRGGFLAFAASVLVWIYANWGMRKALLCAVPLMMAFPIYFTGRMTLIELESGTGQGRIQIWSGALFMLREYPIFGAGPGNFVEYTGAAAHNAFLHVYADLGIFGGTFFLGAFCFAIVALRQMQSTVDQNSDPQWRRTVSTLLAIAVGFCVGTSALSQQYVVTTYLVLWLVASSLNIARPSVNNAISSFGFSQLSKLATASVLYVLAARVFVQVMVHW